MKSSPTGGVKPMAIAGRMVDERERLIGMSNEERAWRRQWLKDQELSPNEPRNVPELIKSHTNILRRLYRYPLDQLGKALEPALGPVRAAKIRYFTGKFIMIYIGGCAAMYYMKYNSNDWTRASGWRVVRSRKSVLPGDPGYPTLSDRSEPADYASRGFKEVALKL